MVGSEHKTIVCPSCLGAIVLSSEYPKRPTKYCIYCGSGLYSQETIPQETSGETLLSDSSFSATLIPGHLPGKEPIQFEIGPYQILKKIGKGGMGEVFLAYDTSCGRRIALKRVRADLMEHKALHHRFLKEARITSQLNHPGIIPIYSIHAEGDLIYYTMPYVQGDTLKQLLRHTRQLEEKGEHPAYGSIPALIRHFMTICQAINLAHSKGVLHRDIKPENIIIGNFDEVMILDWGLAKLSDAEDEEEGDEEISHPLHSLTHAGKIVGTLSYMAPERAMGGKASTLTDIYALGVILYQVLTLQLPFKRKSLKEYPKIRTKEKLTPPELMAPYRDVPKILSNITQKCLDPDPAKRFQSVQALIDELSSFIEGRSEWFRTAQLDINSKEDWRFQEHVLIAEHAAVTRHTEELGWVNLMLSKQLFIGHTKIEVDVKFGEESEGVGFLLGVPQEAASELLNEGYHLWIASDLMPQTKLTRSAVEVYHAPEQYLKRGAWHHITIEKIDHSLYYFVDGELQFSYISHQPLHGPHIGVVLRDTDVELKDFSIYEAGQNVQINCLAVPDAFFSHKQYETALLEYRRIGQSFPGRAEGREALFRAGVTLLEQARASDDEKLYHNSFDEFEKLHNTPGAPLEYIGKALVYEALGEYDEEVKCFELACRRYPKHPLLPVLEEQVIYRMHESSMVDRLATYLFILLVIRSMPHIATTTHAEKLFNNVKKHGEPLYFNSLTPKGESAYENRSFALQIAFHVNKPFAIVEILSTFLNDDETPTRLFGDAIFALIIMGAKKIATEQLLIIDAIYHAKGDPEWPKLKESAAACLFGDPCEHIERILTEEKELTHVTNDRALIARIEEAFLNRQFSSLRPLLEKLEKKTLPDQLATLLEAYLATVYLYEEKSEKTTGILCRYSVENLCRESSPLHYLYGLHLLTSEGEAAANLHFQSSLEVPYPRSWSLAGHYLSDKIDLAGRWGQNAFQWEKRRLYFQLGLYYHIKQKQEEAHFWFDRAKSTLFDEGGDE